MGKEGGKTLPPPTQAAESQVELTLGTGGEFGLRQEVELLDRAGLFYYRSLSGTESGPDIQKNAKKDGKKWKPSMLLSHGAEPPQRRKSRGQAANGTTVQRAPQRRPLQWPGTVLRHLPGRTLTSSPGVKFSWHKGHRFASFSGLAAETISMKQASGTPENT